MNKYISLEAKKSFTLLQITSDNKLKLYKQD